MTASLRQYRIEPDELMVKAIEACQGNHTTKTVWHIKEYL